MKGRGRMQEVNVPVDFRAALSKVVSSGSRFRTFVRAFMQTVASALSASPGGLQAVLFGIGGGAVSATSAVWTESEQASANALFSACLQKHEEQFSEITALVYDTLSRVNLEDEPTRNRVESPEYQNLVQKAFRDRSAYETQEKREHLRKLLRNAASPGILPDELISLFIDWLRRYNDLHFKVMAIVRSEPLSTRADIWDRLHRQDVREDSAEADLFASLIMDLSFGHVIRQHREKDGDGRFYRQQSRKRTNSQYLKSRFDDDKPYELTELGVRFVHYVMDELVKKLPK